MRGSMVLAMLTLWSISSNAYELVPKSKVRLQVVAASLNLADYEFSFSASCQKHNGWAAPDDCGARTATLTLQPDGTIELPALQSDDLAYSDNLDNWTLGISMHPKGKPRVYSLGVDAQGKTGIRELYKGDVVVDVLFMKGAEIAVEWEGKDLTTYPELLAMPGATLRYWLDIPHTPGGKTSRVVVINHQNPGQIYGATPGYQVVGPLKDFKVFHVADTIIGQVVGNSGQYEVDVFLSVPRGPGLATNYRARQLFNPVAEGLAQIKKVELLKAN